MITRRQSLHAALALTIGATVPLPAAPIVQAKPPLIIVRWTYPNGTTEDLPTMLVTPCARPYAFEIETADGGLITAREVVG
jgi:hypothetical protein